MKELLYFLKREYGTAMTFVHSGKPNVDPVSGTERSGEARYEVPLAILLPVEYAPTFMKVLQSANFAVDSPIDRGLSIVLVEEIDLPQGYTLDNTDKVIVDSRTFNIIKSSRLRSANALELVVSELPKAERRTV